MSAPASDRRDPLGEPAPEVEITVIPGPRGRTLRQRTGKLSVPRTAWWAVLVLVVALGTAADVSVGGRTRSSENTRGRVRDTHAAADSRSYAYPLRCLSVAIALHDPRFARRGFDRMLRCENPGPRATLTEAALER